MPAAVLSEPVRKKPGLLLVAWHLFRQLKNWQLDDPVDCLARFKANRNTGLLLLLAIVAGRITF